MTTVNTLSELKRKGSRQPYLTAYANYDKPLLILRLSRILPRNHLGIGVLAQRLPSFPGPRDAH